MASPRETVIQMVKEYLKYNLGDIRRFKRKDSFKQASYSRSAAQEILRRLIVDDTTPPLIILEEFRDRMDLYSTVNLKTSEMFSVAKDTAEYFIDLLISD